MNPFRFLLDRTAILFLGIAAGCAIGYAFGSGNETHQAVTLAPEAAPVQGAAPAEAPPPPTGPATPKPAEKAADDHAAPVAATTPAPIVDDQAHPQLDKSVHDGRTVHVGVFGDSFGDGVWSALYRLLPGSAGFQVSKYSQQSTGFTRYKRLNLEEHDAGQIGDQPLDVAVISFGANDAQGVCDGGHCGALMSSYWQQVIGQRVESYVGMLRRRGAAVYWVGLPVMRDRGFDADALAMNGFYRGLMARLGIPFIEIRGLTTDPSGAYEAYYTDADGSPKLLRANDGVHMSMNGYLRITKALAGRIRDRVASAKAGGGEKSVEPPPAAASDGESNGAS